MKKPFDVILKTLVEVGPEGWPVALKLPAAPVTVRDADVSTVGGAADKVLHVAADPPYLLHLDFYAGHDTARAPTKLRWYNAVLDERHDLPVRSVAVILRQESDSPRLTGELVRGFPGRPPHLVFRYDVMRVWHEPAEMFLQGSLGLLPLALVSDVAERQLPEVVEQMKRRLNRRDAREWAGELWTAAFILIGMRYSQEAAFHLLRGITAMEESTTYQYILQLGESKGLAKGRQEGREEGLTEEARQLLFRVGRKRFGEPDAATTAAVNAIAERQRLELLVERALDVATWQELLTPPRRARRRPKLSGQ